jgi:hypothetical protein
MFIAVNFEGMAGGWWLDEAHSYNGFLELSTIWDFMFFFF